MKTMLFLGLSFGLVFASLNAGYSPCTHCSSNDGHLCDADGNTHWNHHLNQWEREEIADPTPALELDTAGPGEREEFSDTLYPILR